MLRPPSLLRIFSLVALSVHAHARAPVASTDKAPKGSPMHFTVPGESWKSRTDLALAIGEGIVDRRGLSAAVVYRSDAADATLQGAFGVRALDSETREHAMAAFQDDVTRKAMTGWIVDKRERAVERGVERVRVEAHDADGLHSITWSAALVADHELSTGLLQCIYPPASEVATRECRAIIASAKLTKPR